MTATAIKQTPVTPLKIEKGIAEYRHEINKLTQAAWQIAYTALWNTLEFSATEKQQAMSFITAFLQQGNSHKKAYTEFVQRILLARQYINSHAGTYIPIPSQWFDPADKNGFAGTAKWFVAIQTTRMSLPQYKITLKAFAEAVLEMMETGTAKDFHYWRNWFITQNCQGLLNLFLSTIANSTHSRY